MVSEAERILENARRRAAAEANIGRQSRAESIMRDASEHALLVRLFEAARRAGRGDQFVSSYEKAMRRRHAMGLDAYVDESRIIDQLRPYAESSQSYLRSLGDYSDDERIEKARANQRVSKSDVDDAINDLLEEGAEVKREAKGIVRGRPTSVDATRDVSKVNPLTRSGAGFARVRGYADTSTPIGFLARGFHRARASLGFSVPDRLTQTAREAARKRVVEHEERRELARLEKERREKLRQAHGYRKSKGGKKERLSEGEFEQVLENAGIRIITPELERAAHGNAERLAEQADRARLRSFRGAIRTTTIPLTSTVRAYHGWRKAGKLQHKIRIATEKNDEDAVRRLEGKLDRLTSHNPWAAYRATSARDRSFTTFLGMLPLSTKVMGAFLALAMVATMGTLLITAGLGAFLTFFATMTNFLILLANGSLALLFWVVESVGNIFLGLINLLIAWYTNFLVTIFTLLPGAKHATPTLGFTGSVLGQFAYVGVKVTAAITATGAHDIHYAYVPTDADGHEVPSWWVWTSTIQGLPPTQCIGPSDLCSQTGPSKAFVCWARKQFDPAYACTG
jgi:hypothetical protein